MLRVIGITYDHTVNYGSCLQACALGRVIGDMRVGGEPCDYRLIPIVNIAGWQVRMKKAGYKRFSVLGLKALGVRALFGLLRTRFNAFEKRYLRYVNVSSEDVLPALNDACDAFVCGSDVVWNPELNYGQRAFYLDFAKKYKFSYAASFGRSQVGDEEIARIREDVLALDAVSCRERAGCEIVRNRIGREAELTVDPVLLLDRETWDDMAEKPRSGDRYIFVYATHLNETFLHFLEALRKATGLKTVLSACDRKVMKRLKVREKQTPQKWLRLLRDAEYVVTNSFHGTAFATLYHKKFFTVVGGTRTSGNNIRMTDFLSAAGLEDRLFAEVPEKLDLGEADFGKADAALAELRERSLAFLRRNLEAALARKQRAGE